MTTQVERLQPLAAAQSAIWAFACRVAIGALAGFVAGVIAGGIGSRVAMRISAIAAGDRFQGSLTEAEARVGEITAGGTIFLLFFGGFIGVFGGLVYLAARPWLADAGRWRGLAFGLLLLATFGWAIIEGDNRDFHLFGPPALNIATFASLYILFGVLVAPIFDRIEGWFPGSLLESDPAIKEEQGSAEKSWLEHPAVIVVALLTVTPVGLWLLGRRLGWRRGRRTLLTLAALGFGLLLTLIVVPAAVFGFGEEGDNRVFFSLLPAYVLLAVPAAALLLARSAGRFERLSDLRGRWGLLCAGCAVLALPVIIGLALGVDAIRDIYAANR